MDSAARGAKAIDLDPVRSAAHAIGIAEDRAIFHGYPEAEIVGICEAAADRALTLTRDYQKYAQVVSDALCKLQLDGVGGPFAIALGPECYRGLMGTVGPGGYPVLHHVQRLIEGPVFLASGCSRRGSREPARRRLRARGRARFSIGYLDHTATTVQLYLEESFTFRVLSPEAAVPLVYR